jgi:TfoX-like protein
LAHDFIRDLFAPFGAATARRMFSGAGIFADGLMFGRVVRDVIYLKVDDINRKDFEREGSPPFTYKRAGRPAGRASTPCPIGSGPNGSMTILTSLRYGCAARLSLQNAKICAPRESETRA